MRHNFVADALAVHLKKVGTVLSNTDGKRKEKKTGVDKDRPGDVVVTWSTASGPETFFIDITVSHMHICNSIDDYRTNHIEKAVANKRKKYYGKLDHRVVPFGMTSSGELSTDTWALIDELATRLQAINNQKNNKRVIMRSLSCALQKGNAIMLCAH